MQEPSLGLHVPASKYVKIPPPVHLYHPPSTWCFLCEHVCFMSIFVVVVLFRLCLRSVCGRSAGQFCLSIAV
jgi:hypothetical protein